MTHQVVESHIFFKDKIFSVQAYSQPFAPKVSLKETSLQFITVYLTLFLK